MRPRQPFTTFCVGLILALACGACTTPPPYAPIVSVQPGTVIPTQALVVSIEDLATHPEKYRGEFVEVTGFNAGYSARPDCASYSGPPAEWGIYSELPIYKDFVMTNDPAILPVKNIFDGMISSPSDINGYALRNTTLKQVAVRGWVQLYAGPVGCGSLDVQRIPIPPDIQQVWYLDAVQLQYLESIEVKR